MHTIESDKIIRPAISFEEIADGDGYRAGQGYWHAIWFTCPKPFTAVCRKYASLRIKYGKELWILSDAHVMMPPLQYSSLMSKRENRYIATFEGVKYDKEAETVEGDIPVGAG